MPYRIVEEDNNYWEQYFSNFMNNP